MISGSGGSHGLCGIGLPSEENASPIAPTRLARSVGMVASSSRTGGASSGRESSLRVSVEVRSSARGPEPVGLPPTREAWNCRRLACPRRAKARPGIDAGI